MSKSNENKLVPKLRFPEFTNEKWEETTLSQVADYENGKAHEQDIVDIGDFIVVNSKFISQDGDVKKFTNTAFCPTIKGDVLMVLSDIPNGKAIAKCFLVEEDNRFTVNQRICRITPRNLNSKILYYLLNRNPYFLAFDDGVKQTNLRKEDVLNCPLLIPSDPKEQDKIAEILSSLDKVITAESQKLDILKDHKKGLLQNLLPQEGETIPKFRFKEFEDSGEWVEKDLGGMTIKVGSGVTPLGGETNYKKTGRPFVRSQNVSWGIFLLDDIAFIDEATHRNSINTEIEFEDVLLNITGASIGRSAVANEFVSGGNVNQHVCIIRVHKDILNPFFLNQFLVSEFGQKQIDSFQAGGNRQGLNFAQIRTFSIPIPPSIFEQQKIADTLASVDELINVQSQKTEALKLHKKGLLQGLFPTLNNEE